MATSGLGINPFIESFDKYQNNYFFVKVPLLCMQLVMITNRAWFLVYLYVLAQIPTTLQAFRVTTLQALIPQVY